MKAKDYLKFSGEILKRLHDFGIKVDDYKYIDLIKEYDRMNAVGEKKTYIVAVLSERYNICKRKIYKILSRLNKDCQECAVK